MTTPDKHRAKSPVTGDVLRLLVILIALMILTLTPGISRAANISFEPGSIGIAINPGEEKVILLTTNLSNLGQSDSYANFFVALTSGSLPRTWASRSDNISLNGEQSSQEVSLTINVPAGTQTGTYTGVFRPIGIRASERTTTNTLSLYVEVMEKSACSQPPIIANVVAGETIVRARNKKPLTFEFSGNISSLPGCTTEKAYYMLTDEYGDLDKTEPLALDDTGNFRVTIPVIASRRGNDKDGRLYTVSFGADNEIGTAVGGEQRIIISHDNRK